MMFNLLKLVFNPLKLAESFISYVGGGGGGAAGPFAPGASGSRGEISIENTFGGGGGGVGASGFLGASGATGATGYTGGAGGKGGGGSSYAGARSGSPGLTYGGGGGGAGAVGYYGASGAQGVIIFTYNDNAGASGVVSGFTLASSGSISLGGLLGNPNRSVNARLALPGYDQISLGSTGVRTAYNVPTGAIRLAQDGYGT